MLGFAKILKNVKLLFYLSEISALIKAVSSINKRAYF